jgi:hypothetical protein
MSAHCLYCLRKSFGNSRLCLRCQQFDARFPKLRALPEGVVRGNSSGRGSSPKPSLAAPSESALSELHEENERFKESVKTGDLFTTMKTVSD